MKDNRPIDVVLVYPRTGVDIGSAVAPPFSLLAVAAPLHNKGIKVKIIDQRVDPQWRTYLKEALKDKPLCCGISTMTGKQILYGIEAANIMRNQTAGAIPIVWGGIHPTLLPEQTVRSQYADIVCVGEGDQTLLDIVTALKDDRRLGEVRGIAFLEKGRFVFTGERPLVNVEELLPTPWDLVNIDSYINPDLYLKGTSRVLDIGQSSRGCPYRCTFCYSSVINRHKWRALPVDRTLDMIVENVKRFNLDGIWLRDDEFFLDVVRVAQICEGMLEKNLNISWYTSGARITDILKASDHQLDLIKRSGAGVMRFGAESGSNRILKFLRKGQTVEQILEVNKRCKKAGIKPVYSLMCGMPTETFAEINKTIDLFFWLQKENPDAALAPLAQYTAFPGTALYDTALEMGLKPPQKFEDWAYWEYHEMDTTGERMPWLNKNERRWIGNLSNLSLLTFCGPDAFSTIKNSPMQRLIKLIARVCSKYFAWRLKRKSYYFVPEIQPVIKAFRLYMKFVNR